MEAHFRPILEPPPEAPEAPEAHEAHSTINTVLSIQPLHNVPQMNDFIDDDDEYGPDVGNAEVSDADSDDFRLQADIAKLDNDVALFKASHMEPESEDLIDPRLSLGSGRKRGPKVGSGRPTKRQRRGPAVRGAAEPTAEVKMLLARASLLLTSDDPDGALEILSEVVRLNAETHEAWATMATVYDRQGRGAEALMAMCFAAHLRPRDFHGWMACAQYALNGGDDDDRAHNVEVAQLCYSAAIRANPRSLKARIGKANCALEAGRSSVAAAEYVKVLRRRPYNMAILRNMAEAAFDTRSARKYVERTKEFYELAINHARTGGQHLRGSFEWPDVTIFVEMCAFLERYSDAALALRSLTRMLLGRQEETFWDDYVDDDREWDQEEDRRREVPEYVPGRYPAELYNRRLTRELRARLAIYRLKLGQEEEATRHLQWLSPTPNPGFVTIQESPDGQIMEDRSLEDSPHIIKELADQLFVNRRITDALEFYDFYEQVTGELDSDLLVQKGKCHLQMEDQQAAEDYFIKAIEADDDNIDARYELAQMYEAHQEEEEAFLLVNEAIQLATVQQKEDEEDEEYAGGEEEEEEDPAAAKVRQRRRIRRKILRDKTKGKKPQRVKRQYVRRMAGRANREMYENKVTESFRSKYHKVLELRERMAAGDLAAEDEWMAAAQDLVVDFRSFKEFYPWDKYLNFMGYGSFFQENRKRAQEKQAAEEAGEGADGGRARSRAGTVAPQQPELAAMAERLQNNLAPEGDNAPEPVLRRQEHRGIPFDQWLDLLLEYAVSLARRQQAQEAYIVCQSARDSIVYKSSDNTFLIHVAWAACAVYAADEETCVAVARFFMRFCHAATDSYRIFSALCRVCQSPVSWYSSGPAQKYILRQIKAMDRGLLPVDLAQSAMGAWDTAVPRDEALGPRHEALDVALLMLYGHILLTSTSYTYALNYFLRAAALDPANPMVNLSTGIAYVHYGMKRQAENRQFILAQGMHYMFEYYRPRSRSRDALERLEAHYNLGRCYHLLGIFHLAAEFYARVLGEAEAQRRAAEAREEKGVVLREFVYESAVNMRTYALTNGDYASARALTETWLVL